MDRYEAIAEARAVLELPERATMAEIKSNYRSLLGQWHPDKGKADKETCDEMTRRIISAYIDFQIMISGQARGTQAYWRKSRTDNAARIFNLDVYKEIMKYCENYQYSFTEKTIKRHLSPEEWWFERFGNDPLWGSSRSPK